MSRHVSIGGLVVGHAGAERVGQRHAARADDRQEPGHAEHESGLEGKRVEEGVVDAAVDHVDLAGPLGRAHADLVVAHEEVAALDQLDAHLLGQERVLEIGAVVAARA